MEEKLFSGFHAISSKQWKQQIQYELKGGDYNDLVWESPEGIKIRPFYHSDEFTAPLPVSAKNSFAICQEIFVHDVGKSNHRAIDSISRGAEEIRFIIPDEKTDLGKLLENIPPEIPLYLELQFLSADFIRKVSELAEIRIIHLLADPIHQLAGTGNWFDGGDNFALITKLPNISADGRLYQNAGANLVQQIAYTLGHLNEYFNRVQNIGSPVIIQMAVGPNYFFEIAKLRAMRLLYGIVAKEYGHYAECMIVAMPSKRNKTLYDYNVNMLRTTTECMSAILGGADSVCNLPYDAIYHKSNEFGERISRNQLLILKHESHFDKTSNAADGSYYIEALTARIADKALQLFKDIEKSGGFLKLVQEGTIQKKILASAEKEQELFDSGKEVLIGTNKYINKADRMAGDLELFPFVKVKSRKTMIIPIIEKRLSEKSEQERLANENNLS